MIKPSKSSQEFEVNTDFAHESVKTSPAEREKTDDVGYIDIPDDKSF